jgi:hypothetical protein
MVLANRDRRLVWVRHASSDIRSDGGAPVRRACGHQRRVSCLRHEHGRLGNADRSPQAGVRLDRSRPGHGGTRLCMWLDPDDAAGGLACSPLGRRSQRCRLLHRERRQPRAFGARAHLSRAAARRCPGGGSDRRSRRHDERSCNRDFGGMASANPLLHSRLVQLGWPVRRCCRRYPDGCWLLDRRRVGASWRNDAAGRPGRDSVPSSGGRYSRGSRARIRPADIRHARDRPAVPVVTPDRGRDRRLDDRLSA